MQDDSIANFDKDGDSVESEETGSSSNETDPSNSSRDTRYSTIDTSVYHHPSVQELNEAHVDTSILLESETPRNRQGIGSVTTQQGFHPSEDVVTSPLDRFQVQVLNGGSYCKVTPIGNTMFSSMQSPIMKAQSPKTTAGKERASANVSSLESSGTSNTIEIQDAIHCDDLVASVVESPQLDRRVNKANQKMPNSEIIEDDEYKSEPTVNSVNESTHSESTESFYSSNTSESDDSNPTCSNTGDVTEYSASAFLPNIEKPIIEYIASNIGNNNVDDNEDKKLTPSCNISPAETPIDGTRSHAKRTPGGTLLSTIMSEMFDSPDQVRYPLLRDFELAMAMWDKHSGEKDYPISCNWDYRTPRLQYIRPSSPTYLNLRRELAAHLYLTLRTRWANLGYIQA